MLTSCQSIPVEENSSELALLEYESHEAIEENSATIYVRASTKKASVYLNGNFQGFTPIEISGLVEGDYFLRLEKTAFESSTFRIEAVRREKRNYHVEMIQLKR